MNPLLVKYPLDLTSTERHNLVLGEFHDISHHVALPFRPVVLDYGYFYADSLEITDSTGYVLLPDRDYQTAALNADATQQSGHEVCGVIVVVNPKVTSRLWIDAQMVGGQYTDVSESIVDLSITLLNDTRSAKWVNIQNRPDVFTPSGHLHPLWDLYGFEPYQEKVDRIHNLLLQGSAAEITEFENDLAARYRELRDERQVELDRLNAHIANKSNPHRVTKTQVGLPSLENNPPASPQEASVYGGGAYNRMMTPYTTNLNIESNFGTALTSHVNNQNNPHQVTTTQLDVHSAAEATAHLNNLLGKTETAVGTNRLNGVVESTVYANIRSGLNAYNVTSGRFPLTQIGRGVPSSDKVLTGDGQWTALRTLINTHTTAPTNILYAGYLSGTTASQDHIKATYANQPVGTIILYHERYYYHRNASNGGTYVIDYYPMHALAKTAGGWFGPFSSFTV